MNNQLTIGQVAKEVGIPAKTIRYYEEIELLQPAKRMDNKYREYAKEVLKMAKELACPSCDVHVHDLNKGCETDECRIEAEKYGIKTVPTVVIDGKVCSCCENQGANREDLKAAGIGTPR